MYTTLCILYPLLSHQCLFICTYATLDILAIWDIHASVALVSLNLANNDLGAEGAQHLAKVLPTW